MLELRRRLLWAGAAFILCFALCYHYAGDIYLFLARPLGEIMRQQGEQPHLIYTALYEAFFTYIRVAFFGAAFLSFPVVAMQAWIFIAPGLYRSEKRAFAPFLIATPILFLVGASLAYYFIFPIAWRFFLSFQTAGAGHDGVQIELQAKVSEYLSLVMKLIDHLMDAYGGRGYDCSLSDILKSNLEFQHRKNYFKSIYDENFYQTRIKLDDFPHEKQYPEYEI